ncbi:hypothetical protein, partial [Burkholderia pseudomallei]|uniref:hypothetical protein n=1 Tax=Burkholderia pseudomallei TaxID=28450 RepID=UPI001959B3AD
MTRIARAAPVASFIEAIARVWRMASRTSCGAHARTIAVLALLPTSSRFLAPSRAFSRLLASSRATPARRLRLDHR